MLNESWKNLYGDYPKVESLCILMSQCVLEDGLSSAWCWNLGNIKKYGDHDWTCYPCSEDINGIEQKFTPPHPQTFFCAYTTPLKAAQEYIQFLSQRTRYKKAWQAVMNGDPADYAMQLHLADYYTASETSYAKTILELFNQFKSEIPTLLKPNMVFPHYDFEVITLDYFTTNAVITTEPEPTDLPDVSSQIDLIKFDWNSPENTIQPIETLPALQFVGIIQKIFALILKLIAAFQKKK